MSALFPLDSWDLGFTLWSWFIGVRMHMLCTKHVFPYIQVLLQKTRHLPVMGRWTSPRAQSPIMDRNMTKFMWVYELMCKMSFVFTFFCLCVPRVKSWLSAFELYMYAPMTHAPVSHEWPRYTEIKKNIYVFINSSSMRKADVSLQSFSSHMLHSETKKWLRKSFEKIMKLK